MLTEVFLPTHALTNILQPSAKAALFCFECRIEAGLVNQVGVKSRLFIGEVMFHAEHHFLL